MTEQEAKEALFKLHFEYMSHPPKKRLKLYDKYQEERTKIKKALAMSKIEKLENERKTK